jgi:hypothetical protein
MKKIKKLLDNCTNVQYFVFAPIIIPDTRRIECIEINIRDGEKSLRWGRIYHCCPGTIHRKSFNPGARSVRIRKQVAACAGGF